MKRSEKILYIYFLLLPIIDLITSLTTRFTNISLTLGVIVKSLTLFFCLIYIFLFSKSKYKKKSIVYLILLIFFAVVYFFSKNYTLNFSTFITEANYALKYFYFPIMLCGMFNMFDDFKFSKNLIIKILIANAITYSLLIIIPFLTSTGFKAYDRITFFEGQKGWFNSANEVGSILTLLLIVIYYIFNYRNKKYIPIILLFMVALAIIGTKVCFLGLVIITLFCMITILIEKKKKGLIPCLIIIVFLLISLLFSPFFSNFTNLKKCYSSNCLNIEKNKTSSNKANNENKDIYITDPGTKNNEDNLPAGDNNSENSDEKADIIANPNNKDTKNNTNELFKYKLNSLNDLIPIEFIANNLKIILSARDLFLIENLNVYINSNVEDILFGLGWNDRPKINYNLSKKIIELDFADIFIHYGVVGFVIYFLPLLYCFISGIKNIKYFNNETWLVFVTFMTEIGISLFAGHILSTPVVSIYLVLLLGLMKITICEEKNVK